MPPSRSDAFREPLDGRRPERGDGHRRRAGGARRGRRRPRAPDRRSVAARGHAGVPGDRRAGRGDRLRQPPCRGAHGVRGGRADGPPGRRPDPRGDRRRGPWRSVRDPLSARRRDPRAGRDLPRGDRGARDVPGGDAPRRDGSPGGPRGAVRGRGEVPEPRRADPRGRLPRSRQRGRGVDLREPADHQPPRDLPGGMADRPLLLAAPRPPRGHRPRVGGVRSRPTTPTSR